MKKRVVAIEGKEAALAQLKKNLSNAYTCFVLITCTEPDEGGKMEVALDYEGDESLAAFLIENAAQALDERVSAK
jgi:hypothetical protein